MEQGTELCTALDAWKVADSVEVMGRFLMVHAAATCQGEGRASSRRVCLPAAATVHDEANATVCTGCSEFRVELAAGEVALYSLS
jgi:hypothetical protein